MKSKLPLLLGLSTVLLATSCSAATESTPKSDASASTVAVVSESPENSESSATPTASPSASASASSSAAATPSASATTKSVTAEEVVPALARKQVSEDRPELGLGESSISEDDVRLFALMSYAQVYVATDSSGDVCLAAWATSGDQDGTGTVNGPNVECEDPTVVKENGLQLEVTGTSDQPEVVLALLPSDLTEKVVRTQLLKIPDNHEDLRPPVEFDASEDGLVAVAMERTTARDLEKIDFPRKDGSTFTLDLK